MTGWEELKGAAPPALLHARLLPDAEEVLVLTYTCDLSFFEDVCLREAQAVRARTTILFDADQLTAGPRRPGPADYLALPVVCRGGGAFHPKLVVIAAETDAVVAIGSGNATESGWHHNAEVWTLLRGEGSTVPALFHSLADWLRRLPERVWLEDIGRDRLERVAELLTARPAETGPDQPVLVTTAPRPVIDQLPVPAAPVTSLSVAAPFFDPKAAALRRLIDRFDAEQVHLLLTRGVQCVPQTLTEAVTQLPAARVSTPVSSRYHHGKVVEWWSGDQGWALTGSANCSQAALTLPMASGGNCELGVLTPIAAPVVNDVPANEIDPADLTELRPRDPTRPDRAASRTPLRVLGVRATADRVEVTVLVGDDPAPAWLSVNGLRMPHGRSAGRLHVYAAAPDPGWTPVAEAQATASVSTEAGIEFHDVIVTDVTAALSRIDRPSPLEDRSLAEVVADPAYTAALFEALTHLARVRPDQLPPAPQAARRRRVEERIRTAVGPALLRFSLGLAEARRTVPADHDLFDDPEPAEPTPTSTQTGAEAAAAPEAVATILDGLTERQRNRLRQDVGRLVKASDRWPLPAQLAVSRLILLLVAGGLWPDPLDWSDLLCWGLSQLRTVDQDESIDGEHAALAVIVLVALRCGLDRQDEPDSELAENFEDLRAAYREWADWLTAAPPDAVGRYRVGLAGYTFGRLFERTDFVAEAQWIITRSPLHDAVDRLAGARLDRHSVVHVAGGRNTRQAVVAALDALRGFPDVHVTTEVAPETHGWWDGRRLLLVSRSGPVWRAEAWTGLITGLAAYACGVPLRPPNRRWTVDSPAEAFAQVLS